MTPQQVSLNLSLADTSSHRTMFDELPSQKSIRHQEPKGMSQMNTQRYAYGARVTMLSAFGNDRRNYAAIPRLKLETTPTRHGRKKTVLCHIFDLKIGSVGLERDLGQLRLSSRKKSLSEWQ